MTETEQKIIEEITDKGYAVQVEKNKQGGFTILKVTKEKVWPKGGQYAENK